MIVSELRFPVEKRAVVEVHFVSNMTNPFWYFKNLPYKQQVSQFYLSPECMNIY